MRTLWNHAPYPIWSLSTRDNSGKANMNICSYVVPISMKPKEFLIAVYYDTQTYENIMSSPKGCLQLLAHDQHNVVKKLGKKSALKYPKKLDTLYTQDSITIWQGWDVLRSAIGYIDIEIYEIHHTTADHALCYARVKTYRSLRDEDVLTTKNLYDLGIIG